MKMWKLAGLWYNFDPTVTLYHGTTEDNLNSIMKDGFKPFNAQDKVDEILQKYGYSRSTVPQWIWFSEFNLRQSKPYIYFTNYKQQAALYSQKPFGEFETSIVDALNRWLKEKGKNQVDLPPYKSVVITVDIPWELVKSYKTLDEYKAVVERVKKLEKQETNEEYLNDLTFEFWIDKPVSNEYIVDWEYANSDIRKIR